MARSGKFSQQRQQLARQSDHRRADQIIVIEGGQITEMGSRAELIRARGHYYDLYTRQFRRERELEYGLHAKVGVAA